MSGVAISYICFNHRQGHPHMLQAAVQFPGSRENPIPLFRKAYARRQVCRAEAQRWTSFLLRKIDRDLEVAPKNQGLLQTHFFANLRRTPSPADTSLSQQSLAADYCCRIDRESECLAAAKVFCYHTLDGSSDLSYVNGPRGLLIYTVRAAILHSGLMRTSRLDNAHHAALTDKIDILPIE